MDMVTILSTVDCVWSFQKNGQRDEYDQNPLYKIIKGLIKH